MQNILEKRKETVKVINAYLDEKLSGIDDPVMKDLMRYYPLMGGKRLRPLISWLVCEALGGNGKESLPIGAGLEVIHNFTLVHDDIMDDSDLRRGKETLYRTLGTSMAINVGDAMFARGYLIIGELKINDSEFRSLIKEVSKTIEYIGIGQYLDMDFENRQDITEEEYMRMIRLKTAVLMRMAARGGAYAAHASDEMKDAAGEYAEKMALAFQIADDLLDLTGGEGNFAGRRGQDIKNGKRTLMVIKTLENLSPQKRREFNSILGYPDAADEDIDRAIELMNEAGAIDYSRSIAKNLVAEAKESLKAFPESDIREQLAALADFMILRNI